ncbi:sulfotransferase domain-containing protein [Limnospira platensis CENA597]|uniref:sulfotransferase domain-containing protein n=1 Tax=Limnospira platensis TaxID=118562 RepID=UPI003D700454
MKTKILALKKRIQAIIDPHKSNEERERDAAEYLIISQPNSGRNWLRVMIGNVFQSLSGLKNIDPENISYFAELSPKIPYVKAVHERFKNPEDYRDKNIILLVRDPRDAVISNYFLKTKRDKSPKWIPKSLSEFIREGYYLDDFIALCNAWKGYHDLPKSFLLLRYEDIRQDTQRELTKVMKFLDVQVSDSLIQEAVKRASFEQMREKETQSKLPNETNPNIDQESLKVREAKVGGYQDKISPEDIDFIEKKLAQELDPSYGYNYFTKQHK